MGAEAKRMTKSISAAMSDEGFAGKLKAWPERAKNFYQDVRSEMRKVTAPSFKEVRATTTVVIIAVFLFGLYFWIVDNTIGTAINQVFKYLTHR